LGNTISISPMVSDSTCKDDCSANPKCTAAVFYAGETKTNRWGGSRVSPPKCVLYDGSITVVKGDATVYKMRSQMVEDALPRSADQGSDGNTDLAKARELGFSLTEGKAFVPDNSSWEKPVRYAPQSLTACFSRCNQRADCQAFNYDGELKICELYR